VDKIKCRIQMFEVFKFIDEIAMRESCEGERIVIANYHYL